MTQPSGEAHIYNLGSSAASEQFTLLGGQYGILAIPGGGSLQLQAVGPDGATAINILSTALTANGVALVTLPGGTYQFANSGSPSGAYVSIAPIPRRP